MLYPLCADAYIANKTIAEVKVEPDESQDSMSNSTPVEATPAEETVNEV